MFSFESIVARPSTGSFELSDALLRRMFSALGDPCTLFGLRFIDDEAESKDIGMIDPRRLQLQEICEQIGSGTNEMYRLRSMLDDNTGFTINSPQSLGDTDPFEEISDLFLAGLNLKQGCYPEKIYTTMYLGTYKTGFGLHKDIGEDTVLFVLDGTKHFVLIENGEKRSYTIEKNRYLAWRAGQEHSAANDNGVWSLTINFAVGSPGVDGPVRYCFPRTERAIAYAGG